MQVIKYRAWDKGKKRFHYWGVNIAENGAFFTGPTHSNLIHELSTLKKDVNDLDIYDGDIIQFWEDRETFEETMLGLVKWENSQYAFTIIFKSLPTIPFEMIVKNFKFIEVLGNIHKNSDLLQYLV